MKLVTYIGCMLCTVLAAQSTVEEKLEPYKDFLINGTYDHQDWSAFETPPKSRYDTFKAAFEAMEAIEEPLIVELGTSRSFVHGGEIGCNNDDVKYWQPNNPGVWDWGAGIFTRMCAMSLEHKNPTIHTVDLARSHINRCRVMTEEFSDNICYHVTSSITFLQSLSPAKSVHLLYLDTGDMTPIEPTAQMQLQEAKLIVERDIIANGGYILIDDVRNQTPRKFGDTTGLGKSKYALAYLLENGFELVMDEYQVLLRKV